MTFVTRAFPAIPTVACSATIFTIACFYDICFYCYSSVKVLDFFPVPNVFDTESLNTWPQQCHHVTLSGDMVL